MHAKRLLPLLLLALSLSASASLIVVNGGNGAAAAAAPGGGSDPYTPQGTIPSGWDELINWPTAPTLTSTATVSNSSELATELVSGADITLNDASYGSLTIPATVDDLQLTAANPGGATFTFLGVHGSRIRINGVRVSGQVRLADELGAPVGVPDNVLFDDVHVTHGSGSDASVLYGEEAHHLAFINSTVLNTADGWPFLVTASVGQLSTDLIVANTYTRATTGSADNDALRVGHTSRIIFMDNWHESEANSANQFRMHNEIEDILLWNNIYINGATKLFIDVNNDGVGGGYARDLLVQDCKFYESFMASNDGPFTSIGSDGLFTGTNSAIDNTHYQGAYGGAPTTMEEGPGSFTYTNNVKQQFESPPTRTAGASH